MHITNQKPVVLVTGSSRGIGRAIALQFAKNHYHVILNCSTSLEQLENVKKEILALPDGSCTCCRCDVVILHKSPQCLKRFPLLVGRSMYLSTMQEFLTSVVHRYDRRSVGSHDPDKSFLSFLLQPGNPALYDFQKKRKNHQYFLDVGNGRRLLRSRLFRRQIRHPRTDEGTGKRTCT